MQGARISRSGVELRQALREQIELLQLACDNFDSGRLLVGRQIAVILRTLLLMPERKKSRTAPLLRQINCLPPRFLGLAFSIDTKRLSVLHGPHAVSKEVPVCGLVNLGIHDAGAAYFAPLDDVPESVRSWTSFPAWWTANVLRDHKGQVMSRLELVQHVADTDGGAHVDGGLVPEYADVKSGVALGICVERNGNRQYLANLELHCMRQIAHEVLSTLRRYQGWCLSSQIAHPLMPRALPCAREEMTIVGAYVALKGRCSFKRPGVQDMTVIGAA